MGVAICLFCRAKIQQREDLDVTWGHAAKCFVLAPYTWVNGAAWLNWRKGI